MIHPPFKSPEDITSDVWYKDIPNPNRGAEKAGTFAYPKYDEDTLPRRPSVRGSGGFGGSGFGGGGFGGGGGGGGGGRREDFESRGEEAVPTVLGVAAGTVGAVMNTAARVATQAVGAVFTGASNYATGQFGEETAEEAKLRALNDALAVYKQ